MFDINKKWYDLLKPVFETEKYKNLISYLETQYMNKKIYPEKHNVFSALNYTEPENVKVVIIGQDPYHQQGQAHGLSFSVNKNIKIPPSLRNIYLELKNDLDIKISSHGNLTSWATEGVLLLNTILTVEEGRPNSHKDLGWEEVTTEILKIINLKTQPVVFMFWGNNAKKLSKYITNNNHLKLYSNHPSPMSANRGGWFGSKHFSKANNFLVENNIEPINWVID